MCSYVDLSSFPAPCVPGWSNIRAVVLPAYMVALIAPTLPCPNCSLPYLFMFYRIRYYHVQRHFCVWGSFRRTLGNKHAETCPCSTSYLCPPIISQLLSFTMDSWIVLLLVCLFFAVNYEARCLWHNSIIIQVYRSITIDYSPTVEWIINCNVCFYCFYCFYWLACYQLLITNKVRCLWHNSPPPPLLCCQILVVRRRMRNMADMSPCSKQNSHPP
jgi:hypothetical protein